MSAFDLSAIMKEAHAQARRYAKPGQYRKALVWALRMAWHSAKGAARFAAVLSAQTPEQRPAARRRYGHRGQGPPFPRRPSPAR